uniref:Uncharacterized protein n=1 Tax=Leersia perrieri TaxID=77586 RepID=A0A0D9Y0G4_9ORYZ
MSEDHLPKSQLFPLPSLRSGEPSPPAAAMSTSGGFPGRGFSPHAAAFFGRSRETERMPIVLARQEGVEMGISLIGCSCGGRLKKPECVGTLGLREPISVT